MTANHNTGGYYVPEGSHWPIVGAIGLIVLVLGALAAFNHFPTLGPLLLGLGTVVLVIMIFGWFSDVIYENRAGLHNNQMDRSYRWGMVWFIFSEVMFFAAFFGALFYARQLSAPWLGGAGHGEVTHYLLWPDFNFTWPLLINPDPSRFISPKDVINAWGLPAINTLLLLSSGVTITWAHWALKLNKRSQLVWGLFLTICLGVTFLICQAMEYVHAYEELGLTLGSGIYGSTFFMLTGFHGLHVTIGSIMLMVIFARCRKGHFTPEKHFGFEAVAWYWHFVDFVWILLFIIVYWL